MTANSIALAMALCTAKHAVLLSSDCSNACPIVVFKASYTSSSREGVAAGAGASAAMTVFFGGNAGACCLMLSARPKSPRLCRRLV